VRIYTNNANEVVVTNWSGVHGVPDEVKLATVKSTTSCFTNGDVFFGSDIDIGWVSADGTRSNLTWCRLTNSIVTNALFLRGSLYVDQTGVWSNHLIAVTSDDSYSPDEKGVWRIDGEGHPKLITTITTHHLEGVITMPNTNVWGPWAGKILTGDEAAAVVGAPVPRIYSVSTNGTTTSFTLGIAPEDFDIIPLDHDLYCLDATLQRVVKLPSACLSSYVGDLLITQEGTFFGPPKLFIVHWDTTITNFVVRSIPSPDGSLLEHVTFAPIHLPGLP
jgi:hypothetical protein